MPGIPGNKVQVLGKLESIAKEQFGKEKVSFEGKENMDFAVQVAASGLGRSVGEGVSGFLIDLPRIVYGTTKFDTSSVSLEIIIRLMAEEEFNSLGRKLVNEYLTEKNLKAIQEKLTIREGMDPITTRRVLDEEIVRQVNARLKNPVALRPEYGGIAS